MNKHCRHCKEPLPPYALHFSNTVAIKKGYCCYFCMTSALGEEKALRALQEYQEKRVERPYNQRPQSDWTNRMNKEEQNATICRDRGKNSVLELILSDDPQGNEG